MYVCVCACACAGVWEKLSICLISDIPGLGTVADGEARIIIGFRIPIRYICFTTTNEDFLHFPFLQHVNCCKNIFDTVLHNTHRDVLIYRYVK